MQRNRFADQNLFFDAIIFQQNLWSRPCKALYSFFHENGHRFITRRMASLVFPPTKFISTHSFRSRRDFLLSLPIIFFYLETSKYRTVETIFYHQLATHPSCVSLESSTGSQHLRPTHFLAETLSVRPARHPKLTLHSTAAPPVPWIPPPLTTRHAAF